MRIIVLLILMIGISISVLFLMLPQMMPAENIRIDATPERLARGDYLFNNVLGCPVCHSERDWSRVGAPPIEPIGGGRPCGQSDQSPLGLAEGGGLPGTICFRNISSDPVTGIGAWSDGEIIRAIREGIDRDGNAMFPIMPYIIYASLSDSDVEAVTAYVRTLPPVDRPLPDTDIDFPVNLAIRLLPQPVRKNVRRPDSSDHIKYGGYLAKVARCRFCHTLRHPRNRLPDPMYEFSGGVKFQGREGFFYSTNLTPDESGLGDMSRAEFIELFRRPPGLDTGEIDIMPWTYLSGMTDADLSAIYDYLLSLPAKPVGGV
jgi:hypothetical protein